MFDQTSNMFDQTLEMFDQTSNMFDQTLEMFDQTSNMFDQTLEMFDQTSHMFDQTLEMFDQTSTKNVWQTGQTSLTRPDKHWYRLPPPLNYIRTNDPERAILESR